MMSEALKNDKKVEKNGTGKKNSNFFLNFEHWDASRVIF